MIIMTRSKAAANADDVDAEASSPVIEVHRDPPLESSETNPSFW
jgi:hypothetical protein